MGYLRDCDLKVERWHERVVEFLICSLCSVQREVYYFGLENSSANGFDSSDLIWT